MKIFVDNCVSYVVASTLNGYVEHLGHKAVHIRNMPCGPDAADVEWIAALRDTSDDWLVITGDLRIHKNRAERLAFKQANLRGVALAPGFQSFPVSRQASMLLWRWSEIEDVIQRFRPPFLFEVPTSGGSEFRTLSI